MRLEIGKSIALVVDIQERLFPLIHNNEALAVRCAMLIRGLRILDVPLVVTEQYSKGLGKTIAPISEAVADATRIEKITFSCCGADEVEARILAMARHQVIVFGIEAHVCVLQTVLDLRQQGQAAIVVEDCISSRRENDKRIAIERMRDVGAIITTAESLLFELMQRADIATFKEISNLVK
ncbi:MAG: isochorismatase family protein [bacterium]|nr:isochorismatase family protein [bacterium]